MSLAAILAECARLSAGGGAGALATVARRRGSLPMSATAKLLVTAGGARLGTIGGGCLEAEVIERCHDVLERRVPAVSEHTLNAELAGDYGLTCGGTATIVVEPVFPDPTLARAWADALAAVAAGERRLLRTGLDWTRGPDKALLPVAGLDEDAIDALPTLGVPGGVSHDAAFDTPSGTQAATGARDAQSDEASDGAREADTRVLTELVAGLPRLVVFGGGHVGGAIARAATTAGWRVTVVDDRAEFADRARHPTAAATVTCDWHDVGASLDLDAATYAVVATRGHQHDALIVDQLARRDLRYLGMLGSRRKVALTWELLASWGVPRERLDGIHAPIGIPIGADTPEEIAVSVVAEMIGVRRAGSRRRGGAAAPSATRTEFQDHATR
ncbi:MAG: XdhC family protein [Gemmatimonadetes bacterium]|nr:XdhC family protein [Gemmatimonadota bacterium]